MNGKNCLLTVLLLVVFLAASGCSVLSSNAKPDAENLREDLTFIASQPREENSEHLRAVGDLCAARFEELGYEVQFQEVSDHVNVIGWLRGTKEPDEIVIVSAHYDTSPNCRGADDNGSGVAAVLETARVLGDQNHDRTLAVVCFDGEENGMIGSKAFVTKQRSQNAKIVTVYNYEMIGYRSSELDSQQ